MKSERNIVKDILHAQGYTDVKAEDVTPEAVKALRDYGHAKYRERDDDARYEYEQ